MKIIVVIYYNYLLRRFEYSTIEKALETFPDLLNPTFFHNCENNTRFEDWKACEILSN